MPDLKYTPSRGMFLLLVAVFVLSARNVAQSATGNCRPASLIPRTGKEPSAKIFIDPPLAEPLITPEGDANGAPHPDNSFYAKKFSGRYSHRIIKGAIGHNLPQEAPQAFAKAVVEVDSF
jgi:hypothetical protein